MTRTSLADALTAIESAIGRRLNEGEAGQVKVEVVVVCRDAGAMATVNSAAEAAFNRLYDRHKKAISKLPESRRLHYDRLRLATAKPADLPWRLPDCIDWRRAPGETARERHLFVDEGGQFSCALGSWEAGVLDEELASTQVLGWLRNVDRKPWALEVPYETGGKVRPVYPDKVILRKEANGLAVAIREPHDPSLADNVDKVRGRFAERHGGLFGRIQLIRKHAAPGGGERFVRLGACRTWGVDSEKRPQRGQFLSDLQAHSPAMGQKAGKKWTAEAISQPTIPKPDRLLGPRARPRRA